MRIALITDAWEPQTNGVVTTLRNTCRELEADGATILRISPESFRSMPCPSYPEIRLALGAGRAVARSLDDYRPQAIHIATEGPLGIAARAWCRSRRLPFTTSYHTQFPEYARARWPIPLAFSYGYMRAFHGAAARTMVGTASLREMLERRGLRRLALWSRGVDTQAFAPWHARPLALPRPIMLYAGRVSVEKNIEAFLELDRPGTRIVVGDGPALATLRERYPAVRFTGRLSGAPLAEAFASADVFVFPSRTDTFGLVMLEAMASGVPVAAYPVTGPIDVVRDGETGALDADLGRAVDAALRIQRSACREFALQRSWRACTREFAAALVPIRSPA